MLSKKDLIDVEDEIHTLNICDHRTPTIHFAEVKERTLACGHGHASFLSRLDWLAGPDPVCSGPCPLLRKMFRFPEESGYLPRDTSGLSFSAGSEGPCVSIPLVQ